MDTEFKIDASGNVVLVPAFVDSRRFAVYDRPPDVPLVVGNPLPGADPHTQETFGEVPADAVDLRRPPAGTVDAILAERGSRYGKFVDHARITQALKRTARDFNPAKWDSLADDQKEALEMLFHKIGRVLNGDPDYADSWVDIAGYSKLVADRLEGVVR